MSENFWGEKPKRSGTAPVNPLHDLIEGLSVVLWKRKWIVTPPIFMGCVLGVFLAFYISPLYKSSTLILIEPQQVPKDYVKSTDTTPVQARLNTLQQQIMSRTKLEKIIKEYEPYRKVRRKGWMGQVDSFFENMKNLLTGGADREKGGFMGGPYGNRGSRVSLEDVERMRKDIKVKITGGRSRRTGSVAFSISYTGASPQSTMEITNAIAGLYIEENLKLREQYAEGTSEFLRTELERSKKELTRQENEVKVFKEENIGTLPGQLQANLMTLDRLQLNVQAAYSEIKDLKDERVLLKDKLEREKERRKLYGGFDDSGEPTKHKQLRQLKANLKNLLSLFKENYPDVIITKHRIKEMETEILSEKGSLPPGQKASGKPNKFMENSYNVIGALETRIRSINFKITKMRSTAKKLAKKVRKYEKRVEDTPKSEQVLADILRDYEISRANYEALLEKKLSASMAENMEKRQKGERFRVVDPANLPEKPIKPKKIVIIITGVILGTLTSGLILFFLDFYRAVYRRPEDIYADFSIPVLASIPDFKQKKGKKIPQKSSGIETILKQVQQLDSMVMEQYYVLFTKLGDISRKHDFRIFAVTSSVQGEGKTETSLHLAYVIARQFKKKVILVDCDLRKSSSIAASFLNPDSRGFADVIKGKAELEDVILPIQGSSLSILPSRGKTRNSIRLLDSEVFTDVLFRLKEEFDYVILDSPPSLFFADMSIIAKKSDAVLYVVRAGSTPKNLVSKGIHSFDHQISGVVLNGVDLVLKKKYFKEYT